MKVAYLILAHNTPHHMQRLVRALDSPNAVVVVHVDRKSDITPFRAGLTQSNVTFLEDRLALYWGEYPIVPATIRLIEEGLKHQPDYLCLLSGSDYPLRSMSYIEDFFDRQKGREFIDLVPIPCDEIGKPMGRVTDYWLQTPIGHPLVIRAVSRLNHTIRQLGIKRDHTRVFGDLVPYAGSTWWGLTADACHHILRFVAARPDMMRFMRNVYMPDESFFQIVIGNSPFAARVARGLTYTDWSRPVAPAIIDMGHLRAFSQVDAVMGNNRYGTGEFLFARKFPDDSAHLTAFADEHVRHERVAVAR